MSHLQDLYKTFEDLFSMANIDYDDVIISYGYLGDLLPEEYFQKKYVFESETTNVASDGDWSKEMLKIKTLSTASDYLIESYGIIHEVHLSTFVTSLRDNTPLAYALHDDLRKRIYMVNDSFRILRCITFENYIRAANIIKRAWKVYKLRKLQACIVIQRAYLNYLYNPEHEYIQRIHDHFVQLSAVY